MGPFGPMFNKLYKSLITVVNIILKQTKKTLQLDYHCMIDLEYMAFWGRHEWVEIAQGESVSKGLTFVEKKSKLNLDVIYLCIFSF